MLDDGVHVAASSKNSVEQKKSLYEVFGKRALDFFLASIMLVLLLPLLVVLGLVISLDGGWPIFSHRRVGRNGVMFRCYKLRTMVSNAEVKLQRMLDADPSLRAEWESTYKLNNDPRITRLGKFLRKSSLDELPQLWNVIRGEMSLVGPRPITQSELTKYGASADDYLSVRPGMTGLWQVRGRGTDMSYEERIGLDQSYVQMVSPIGDMSILFRTAFVMIGMKGS